MTLRRYGMVSASSRIGYNLKFLCCTCIINALLHIYLLLVLVSLTLIAQGYLDFDKGVAKKFIIDPHGMIKK